MKFLLILIFILNSSCVHLNSTDYQAVDLESSKVSNQQTITFDKLQIENLVYTENVYPLEESLRKLVAGDFDEVLNNIDFKYKPSNTDNKIILELLKEGLVPVYVNVKNTGSEPAKISEKNFYISGGAEHVQAMNLKNVPRSFKRFNAKAIAVNAYNISVVVVGTVVALAMLGIIFKGGSFPSGIGSGGSSKGRYSSSGGGAQDKNTVINDTQITTKIDYRKYLISEQTIEPNQSIQGLLFFRVSPASSKFSLKFH